MGILATTLRVLLGLLLLLIGVWGAYDQSARKVATEGALVELRETVAAGLPAMTADTLTDRYDGQPVLVQGELTSGLVSDPLTGLELGAIRLERVVELRQWEERKDCEYTGKGVERTRTCERFYERVWSRNLIDSDNFGPPIAGESEHVNPRVMPLQDGAFSQEKLTLGVWPLETAYFSAASNEWKGVPAEMLAAAEVGDDWRAEENYLYSGENPDVRLRYEYIAAPIGSVSLIAIPQDGRLTLTEELAGAPLLVSGDADAQTIVAAGTGQVREVQWHWIVFTFAGLMLLIRPVASLLPRFNAFTSAPFGKRIAMTAGIAAGMTLVISLLLPD